MMPGCMCRGVQACFATIMSLRRQERYFSELVEGLVKALVGGSQEPADYNVDEEEVASRQRRKRWP